jgi:rare lipoprotein A
MNVSSLLNDESAPIAVPAPFAGARFGGRPACAGRRTDGGRRRGAESPDVCGGFTRWPVTMARDGAAPTAPLRTALLASALLLGATAAAGGPPDSTAGAPQSTASPQREATTPRAPPDLSARARAGKASFYARKFTGRTMADGNRMDPAAANAASKTLPLGTTARVTNLETGLSADVTIEDRGPYVKGRIVDLSPATAREIGIDAQQGVARVVVAPIAVPLPGGGVKRGVTTRGAADLQASGSANGRRVPDPAR